MARRRNRGRPVNGIFLLNKPKGLTSNQALQRVKNLFDANKAGHTGSLDPLATGVLPICLGEATKFSQFLLDSDKHYRSTFTLGVTTDTGDCDGDVREKKDASTITERQVLSAIEAFKGEIQQVPSMYSALKHNGTPLYQLARQGITVERSSRRLMVYQCDITDFKQDEVTLLVKCSKGTYIRSLAHDLGMAMDSGAYLSQLRRTSSGSHRVEDALSIEDMVAALDTKRRI